MYNHCSHARVACYAEQNSQSMQRNVNRFLPSEVNGFTGGHNEYFNRSLVALHGILYE